MRFDNPPIPFCNPVFGVRDGTEVDIHGYAYDGSHGSFAVEFLIGNDIALHFNPRGKHHGNTIVLNSMVYGQWQNEERHHFAIHHFHHEKEFHLKIHVHHHHFKIHVNGHHICDFHHRLPYQNINQIRITHDIVVKHVEFHHVEEAGMPMTAGYGGYPQPVGMGGGVVYGQPGYVQPAFGAPPVMGYGGTTEVVVIEEEHHRRGHHHHHH